MQKRVVELCTALEKKTGKTIVNKDSHSLEFLKDELEFLFPVNEFYETEKRILELESMALSDPCRKRDYEFGVNFEKSERKRFEEKNTELVEILSLLP